MAIEKNGSKGLIIAALVMIILQGANLVGVAINRVDIVHNAKLLDVVAKDYVPMWFLEGMQKNNDYKIEEIIATINGDVAEIKRINAKYIDFQKDMINNLAHNRGGYTMIVRSVDINQNETYFK